MVNTEQSGATGFNRIIRGHPQKRFPGSSSPDLFTNEGLDIEKLVAFSCGERHKQNIRLRHDLE